MATVNQTDDRKARDAEIREQFRHRPSREQLITSGEITEDSTTLGAHVEFRAAMQELKALRQSLGLSLDDVAARSGMDRVAVSKLENGHNANPTIATVARYAAALGKIPVWNFESID
ncbi:MAG TPA: helix-turn-helix transcriptional regulator [Isosphaeraceae bacterium]|nr:helix-turn-helix transcriptional regulator [Isosphaeraceae bacterium]